MQANHILVVDDEVKVCEIVGRFLQAKGFVVSIAHNGLEALEVLTSQKPDVVVMDIRMPKMDGVECLKRIKETAQDTEVIMATAVGELDTGISCMKEGAFGYLHKPLNLENLLVEISRALEHRRLVRENKDYQENLEKKVEERTREVRELNEKLKDSFLKSVRITLGILEIYDPFLASHSKRVSVFAVPLAYALGLSKEEVFDVELAALLHEVGQVAVPEEIKNAPFENLSKEEIDMVREYPTVTQKILSPSEELQRAGILIRHHLEHLDGTGFPDGLKGDEIPAGSRILGLVNAYDELMNRRRFTSESFSSDQKKEEFVFSELQKNEGSHYQPGFIPKLKEILDVYNKRTKTKSLCTVDELKQGMIVASDIILKSGRLLIKKGSILSNVHVARLNTFHQINMLGNKFFVFK
jgi:response regulator RpfG family c-di-GMP phosphodiesterase